MQGLLRSYLWAIHNTGLTMERPHCYLTTACRLGPCPLLHNRFRPIPQSCPYSMLLQCKASWNRAESSCGLSYPVMQLCQDLPWWWRDHSPFQRLAIPTPQSRDHRHYLLTDSIASHFAFKPVAFIAVKAIFRHARDKADPKPRVRQETSAQVREDRGGLD